MANNTQYITVTGDRWDTISLKAYGDSTLYEAIITANPAIPVTDVLPSGLILIIPILEEQKGINVDSLPPWKR